MTSVFVIGNGESRRDFDLNKLNKHKTFGCNGLHRDYAADVLVACDKRMAKEISVTGKEVYTRHDWQPHFRNTPQVKYVPELPYKGDTRPDEPFQWGSGSYAVLLAATEDVDTVYMLGFDLYGLDNHTKHNNIYKGTTNYNDADYRAVGPQYWIHQISKLFEIYTDTKFIIVIPDDWKRCPEWEHHTNKSYINYKALDKII